MVRILKSILVVVFKKIELLVINYRHHVAQDIPWTYSLVWKFMSFSQHFPHPSPVPWEPPFSAPTRDSYWNSADELMYLGAGLLTCSDLWSTGSFLASDLSPISICRLCPNLPVCVPWVQCVPDPRLLSYSCPHFLTSSQHVWLHLQGTPSMWSSTHSVLLLRAWLRVPARCVRNTLAWG